MKSSTPMSWTDFGGGVKGVEDRVRIIDTGRPGRIGTPRYRLLPINMAGSAETLSR